MLATRGVERVSVKASLTAVTNQAVVRQNADKVASSGRTEMELTSRYQDLAGKSVFITGGGSGIGAALTEAFVQQGSHVTFVQRSPADEFCHRLKRRYGRSAVHIPCDVTDIPALRRAIKCAAAAHGGIHVLVNNAASDARHTTEEVSIENWDNNQAVNLRPYFFAAQAVVDGMRSRKCGSIINITSISYMMGNASYPAYVTANAGITGLTRGLAREFGPDGIRVNAIAPGWVLTARQLRLWATPESLAAHLDKQCLKEHLRPEHIAGGCLFLASSASSMMTGQVMAIDGGVVTTG